MNINITVVAQSTYHKGDTVLIDTTDALYGVIRCPAVVMYYDETDKVYYVDIKVGDTYQNWPMRPDEIKGAIFF